MPTFSISIPPENETIYPSPEGQAAVSCTVTNSASFPARGKATIIARDGTPASWISLQGADERDFLPAEAQSFSVLVAVPPDAAAKSYGFQLNVANIADPNRDFVEGKIVSVEWKGK